MLACPKTEYPEEDFGFCASRLLPDDEPSSPGAVPKEEPTETPCIFPEEKFDIEPGPSTLLQNFDQIIKDVLSPNRPRTLYDAVVVPAMLGKHCVLYYRTYGVSDLCLAFQWKRNCKNGYQAYVCSVCKLKGVNVKIDVLNYKFVTDPVSLPHVCRPLHWPMEAAKRRFFDATKRLRTSDSAEKPATLYKKMVTEILEDNSLSSEEKMNQVEAMGPFEKHRRALSRAVNAPGRVSAITKRKLDEEKTKIEVETGLEAVNELLEKLRETREMLQEPPAKKRKVE